MAVDLDSGTGLFDRWGKLGHLLNKLNAAVGGSASGDLPTELNDVLVKYDGASNNIRAVVDNLYDSLVTFQGTNADVLRTAIQSAAQNTLIEMVDADNPLTDRTVANALDELIAQMEANSESVDASEPSIASLVDGPRTGAITGATQANPVVVTSTAHGLAAGDIVAISGVVGMTEINNRQFNVGTVTSNTFQLEGEDGTGHTAYSSAGTWKANYGNGLLVNSILSGKGKTLENILAEDLVLKITTTSTAGDESGSLQGEDALTTNKLHHNWPSGSDSSTTITVQNPSSDGFLTNGDFEAFTTNAPDNWTIDVGAAGTDVLEYTASPWRGSSALQYVGDGATLTKISQALTVSSLASRTPYVVYVRVKMDTVPAAGNLIIDLYDGTNVINDDAGTANSLSIDLTAGSATIFRPYTAVWRLPEPVPAAVSIRVRLSTALTSSRNMYLDDLILVDGTGMLQAYTAGPYAALIRGSVDVAKDDQFVTTVTNAREGALQELCDKFCLNPDKLLPSATGGSETIADSLIG